MIRVERLDFRYPRGDFALRVASLAVAPREHTAVVGPSGSGKTTLLRLVSGIAVTSPGCMHTAGVDPAALSEAARRRFRLERIGLVFQGFELLEYLDVRENVLLPHRLLGSRPSREARRRADGLIERVGLAHQIRRRPAELSHGERQRVAVCRALALRPDLVLADEPTGNLDPTKKRAVLELLLECAREAGATVVVVTHDHDLLERFVRVVDLAALSG